MKHVIVGTAGHIDHGKTALVRALTGIDTDRLAEEKRRGITIDIGFANLELAAPSGEKLRIGFVDVPGHERFIRNMLAGVGGIDMVLLIISAEESVKPQTREHFDICRLLGIERGITVLTKSDLVEPDMLELVKDEAREFVRGSFLEKAPIVAVSAKTGSGLDELRNAMVAVAAEVHVKNATRNDAAADRPRVHHERSRDGGDGYADFRHRPQRAGGRGTSAGTGFAGSQCAGARSERRKRGCRAEDGTESRGLRGGRVVAWDGAQRGRTVCSDSADRRKAGIAGGCASVEEPRAGTLPCAFGRDSGNRGPALGGESIAT